MEISYIKFTINTVYFVTYYNLFFYELSSSNINDVLIIISSHLLSESIQSIFQFSQIYFDQRKNFFSKLNEL